MKGHQRADTHRKRHELLHRYLDELVADWIATEPRDSRKMRSIRKGTILELMQWSAQQKKNPDSDNTPSGAHFHLPRRRKKGAAR